MPLHIRDLLQPVAGDNPGGTDIRYEPVLDKIRQARIEELDLPAGEYTRERKTADYGLVVKLATEVLTKQSKDLQVAAWLTEALLQRDGVGGFRTGPWFHPRTSSRSPSRRASSCRSANGCSAKPAARRRPGARRGRERSRCGSTSPASSSATAGWWAR